MNPIDLMNKSLLPAAMPTWMIIILAVIGITGWIMAHKSLQNREGTKGWIVFIIRVFIGSMALIALTEAVMRSKVIVFVTSMHVWLIMIFAASAVETVIRLYSLERGIVSRKAGITILACRIGLIILAALILCQPIFSATFIVKVDRKVAVLLDTSRSMLFSDNSINDAEKIGIADACHILPAGRNVELIKLQKLISDITDDLKARNEIFDIFLKSEASPKFEVLSNQSEIMKRSVEDAAKRLSAQKKAFDGSISALKKTPAEQLADVSAQMSARLEQNVIQNLNAAAAGAGKIKKDNPANKQEAVAAAAKTGAAISDLLIISTELEKICAQHDKLLYDSLNPQVKARIQEVIACSRLEIARKILASRSETARKDKTDDSLIESLKNKYKVKFFDFSSAPDEIEMNDIVNDEKWKKLLSSEAVTNSYSTDIASSIEAAASEVPPEELAGIVVISDGKHNAKTTIDSIAAKLASQGSKVASVYTGSAIPPVDASIVSVKAPQNVFLNDNIAFDTEITANNMTGKALTLTLSKGSKTISQKTVNIENNMARLHVELADKAWTNGLQSYTITIGGVSNEITMANNTYPVHVMVGDDRVKILLIDNQPRWEFRYLKNMFSVRNKNIKFQYVLFNPDKIEGSPEKPVTYASATSTNDENEATALPQSLNDWMLFDIIILGDVDKAKIGEMGIRAMNKFVTNRGGTLIVIAGRNYMPHFYGGSALADILPVEFAADDKPVLIPPEKSFRIALTPEGANHPIMKLEADETLNNKIWGTIPEIYWRHPIRNTKQGATVLAYARPDPAPSYLDPKDDKAQASEDSVTLRQNYQRQNALLAFHHSANGNVFFLAFDSAWRLRYIHGEKYYYRLWNQMIQFASSDRIVNGTDFIKLDTDKWRYEPTDKIKIRSKIMASDFSPVNDAKLVVDISSQTNSVLRKRLSYQEDSPGIYTAEIGSLPEGIYKVSFDVPASNAKTVGNLAQISSEFGIMKSETGEILDLSSDKTILSALANATGGKVCSYGEARNILDIFGPSEIKKTNHRQYNIWDSWPMFILFLILAGIEWMTRKNARLP